MEKNLQIVIVDFGSQYTTIIARNLAALGYGSVVIDWQKADEYLANNTPKAVILSGGNASVYDESAPTISPDILSGKYYVLGICYGMQLVAYLKDPSLVQSGNTSQKGYGSAKISLINRGEIFKGLGTDINGWTSHGDVVKSAPEGFRMTAFSGEDDAQNLVLEGMQSEDGKVSCVQFHPEVIQTEDGDLILANFAAHAKCEKDWDSGDIIESIQRETVSQVGTGRALLGASGGVDSTALAAILYPVLRDRLVVMIIDHGAMRKSEIEQVSETMKGLNIPLKIVEASRYFLDTIGDETEPEKKRAKFMKAYAYVFDNVIREEGITHMIQGTLATDLIESGKKGKAALIKSHHNIVDFSVPKIEPFSHLFKYEVRAIAAKLGLDKAISERKPFPGPGIYLRILGVPMTRQLVETVQWADDAITSILISEGCYDPISQLVVALDGTMTTGVKGDAGVLGYSIIVRPVTTSDFMTVEPYYLPADVMKRIGNEITKHSLVNRVFYDYTSKPPATTEFQ